MNAERGAGADDAGEDLEAEETTAMFKGRRQCLRKDERSDGQGKGFFMGRNILPRHTCAPHWGAGQHKSMRGKKRKQPAENGHEVLRVI